MRHKRLLYGSLESRFLRAQTRQLSRCAYCFNVIKEQLIGHLRVERTHSFQVVFLHKAKASTSERRSRRKHGVSSKLASSLHPSRSIFCDQAVHLKCLHSLSKFHMPTENRVLLFNVGQYSTKHFQQRQPHQAQRFPLSSRTTAVAVNLVGRLKLNKNQP